MENAADALKIAFAMFMFVIAITITFSLISQAKSTADYVLFYADKTNFYDKLDSKNMNRTVGITDVISTLYRCSKESISVTIDLGGSNKTTFDLSTSQTTTNKFEENLGKYIKEKLLTNENREFTEEFVEVPIGGIYETGEDGTEITLTPGEKKLYITYTLK